MVYVRSQVPGDTGGVGSGTPSDWYTQWHTTPTTPDTPVDYSGYKDAVERIVVASPPPPAKPPTQETSINQIVFNEQTMTEEAFTDLILDEIGNRELLTIARHDSLTGMTAPKYSPIKNISSVLFSNSPINIAPNPNSTIDYFDTFVILLSSYLPTDAEIDALDSSYKKSYVYYEPSNNSVIINTANVFNNEGVEIEFVTFNSLNDDTIYT